MFKISRTLNKGVEWVSYLGEEIILTNLLYFVNSVRINDTSIETEP